MPLNQKQLANDLDHGYALPDLTPVTSFLPMTRKLGHLTELLKPSPTLAMAAKAKEMSAQGVSVIDFSAGQPDFNTPDSICEAGIKAIQDGKTKYGPSRGFPELRKAIIQKVKRDNKFECNPNQIVVGCGAKHNLYNAFQVLLNPGDEVILIAPYWATYADQIILAGGTPVAVKTTSESGFQPTIEQCKSALTNKTKAIVINSPSNPTGCAFDYTLTRAIADFALENNLWIISDEIYELLTYNHKHTSIASLGPQYAESTITILGCSKSYAMTGWRIGFSIANEEVTTAMANLQDQITSNATSISQFAAIAAMELDLSEVEKMRATFESRRKLILDELNQIPNIATVPPQGAFYVFVNIEKHLGGKFKSDWELADALLAEAHISTVAGSAFDAPGHLRLSYACSPSDIKEGISRLKSFLATSAS